MTKSPIYSKPVSQVINSKKNSEFTTLLQKITEINRIKKAVLPLLDPNLIPYIAFSFDFKKTLILIVANDSVAMRMRMQTEELIIAFRAIPSLQRIKEIRVKIQSHQHTKKNVVPKQVALLSEENANFIQEVADNLTDKELKQVMGRIAKRKK